MYSMKDIYAAVVVGGGGVSDAVITVLGCAGGNVLSQSCVSGRLFGF